MAPSATSATEKKTPAANVTPAVAKPLESDFDLLSLSQQSGQPQTVPTKPAIANDLLCLGGKHSQPDCHWYGIKWVLF